MMSATALIPSLGVVVAFAVFAKWQYSRFKRECYRKRTQDALGHALSAAAQGQAEGKAGRGNLRHVEAALDRLGQASSQSRFSAAAFSTRK